MAEEHSPESKQAAAASCRFWQEPADLLLTRLAASRDGLSSAEAAERLQRYGPNETVRRVPLATLRRIWRKATEPLVLVLLAAAAVSGVTGEHTGFWTIVVILALSMAIDVVQETRAAASAEALRKSVTLTADALRDGVAAAIAVHDIVPGDVVELRAGDIVPADGVVLSERDLYVNQALLTGEPYPVEKDVATSQASDIADAGNALFMGSSVVSGSARMLVVATGGATEFGGISAGLEDQGVVTAFERSMHQFSRLVVRITSVLVLVVVLAHLAFQRPMIESFLFALALAVGLTPELLPMIMTVSLSRGAMRLAQKGVIVKRLSAIHSLGAMTVLCTDKTGTLTEAKIELMRTLRDDGADDEAVFRMAWLNSHFETGVRSPLDDAIIARGSPADAANVTKIDEVPFDFERRRVSVLIEEQGDRRLIIKGAPEDVLKRCATFETRALAQKPFDDVERTRIRALHDRLAGDGLRLLAIAWRDMPDDATSCHIEDENRMVFAGFAAFLDPPKPSSAAALQALRAAGVVTKVISGDNELVVRHLANAVGLDAESYLIGADIAGMDDGALAAAAARTSLFCRVSPAQKSRVIAALKARGATVGYMGDGVNDAPSLHISDIGISVDSGTDVAKQAAAMILTRSDLGIVAEAAIEGRRTFANVSKYLLMGTSSNFGNMLSMAVASLFLPFLPMLPTQILVNNLLYDISEFGIPLDYVDAEETAQPERWDMGALKRFTFVMGAVSSIYDLITFASLIWVFHAGPALFRTAWFVESMATQILVIFIIRNRGRLFSSWPHPALTLSSLGGLAVAVGLPFTPLGPMLEFVLLPWHIWAAIIVIVVAYLLTAYVARRWVRPPA